MSKLHPTVSVPAASVISHHPIQLSVLLHQLNRRETRNCQSRRHAPNRGCRRHRGHCPCRRCRRCRRHSPNRRCGRHRGHTPCRECRRHRGHCPCRGHGRHRRHCPYRGRGRCRGHSPCRGCGRHRRHCPYRGCRRRRGDHHIIHGGRRHHAGHIRFHAHKSILLHCRCMSYIVRFSVIAYRRPGAASMRIPVRFFSSA